MPINRQPLSFYDSFTNFKRPTLYRQGMKRSRIADVVSLNPLCVFGVGYVRVKRFAHHSFEINTALPDYGNAQLYLCPFLTGREMNFRKRSSKSSKRLTFCFICYAYLFVEGI